MVILDLMFFDLVKKEKAVSQGQERNDIGSYSHTFFAFVYIITYIFAFVKHYFSNGITINKIITEIHIGEVTHHQDQWITPHNLRTKNI